MADSTDTDALWPREWRAAEALLAGANMEAAAAVAGVSPRTLRRWRRQPRFCTALREAQAQAYDDALGLLRACALDGVRTLREVATDPSVPPAARVSAARALLECSIGHYDPGCIDARITVEGPEVESLADRLQALARARNGGDSEARPH